MSLKISFIVMDRCFFYSNDDRNECEEKLWQIIEKGILENEQDDKVVYLACLFNNWEIRKCFESN